MYVFFGPKQFECVMDRSGFTQKANGVTQKINNELYEICKNLVRQALLNMSRQKKKRLKRKHLEAVMCMIPSIPKGSY